MEPDAAEFVRKRFGGEPAISVDEEEAEGEEEEEEEEEEEGGGRRRQPVGPCSCS